MSKNYRVLVVSVQNRSWGGGFVIYKSPSYFVLHIVHAESHGTYLLHSRLNTLCQGHKIFQEQIAECGELMAKFKGVV